MTPSQKKVLEYQMSFDSYKSHRMLDKDLIITCETENKGTIIPYMIRVGVRGGKLVSYLINGKWVD